MIKGVGAAVEEERLGCEHNWTTCEKLGYYMKELKTRELGSNKINNDS